MPSGRRPGAVALAALLLAALAGAPCATRANEPAAPEAPAASHASSEPAASGEPAAAEAPAEAPAGAGAEAGEPVTRVDAEVSTRLATTINTIRREAGLKPLTVDVERLTAVAATRALDMVRTRTIAPPETGAGFTVEELLSGHGVRWTAGGEAVSWTVGAADEDPLNGLLVGLLANPGNRRFVLARDATHVGVAIALLDGGDGMRLPDKKGKTVPPSERFAVASLILIAKDGPGAPEMAVKPTMLKTGAGATITVEPDGAGRLSVVITDDAGGLLAIVLWDRRVTGRTVLRWDGTIGGKPAAPGTYQVRAFTVDRDEIASDPTMEKVTITP